MKISIAPHNQRIIENLAEKLGESENYALNYILLKLQTSDFQIEIKEQHVRSTNG